MDTIKCLAPHLSLQVHIVGAGIPYMPLGLSLFVKLLQTPPFLTILYFDLLIFVIGSSFATLGSRSPAGLAGLKPMLTAHGREQLPCVGAKGSRAK